MSCFFSEHVIFFWNNLTYLLAKMTQPSASSILTLLRSFEFKTDPSKNSTCVKCLLKRASSSRFGGIQWRKITSTLTSSRSLCKKSLRKYDTDSKVIWPQTFYRLISSSEGSRETHSRIRDEKRDERRPPGYSVGVIFL